MEFILHNCCGLDVHKNTVVACILKTSNFSVYNNNTEVEKQIRKFNTFPDELLQLKHWLEQEGCRHVAIESTGVYWIPVYEVLETAFDGEIEIVVTNARHMRNVPGKKSDVKDSEWIAELLGCGLLRSSFIPPQNVRELREVTRYRKNIVHDIGMQKNRIEKTLQMAGIKLSSIISDIFGVSGRNLINVLVNKGHLTPEDVEREARYIVKEKQDKIKIAINGNLSQPKRDFLKVQLECLDYLLAHLITVESSIDKLSTPFIEEVERLVTIPGIAKTSATAIIAEIGIDMSKFPTAEHFTSWAGLAPGSNESAGKKKAHI